MVTLEYDGKILFEPSKQVDFGTELLSAEGTTSKWERLLKKDCTNYEIREWEDYQKQAIVRQISVFLAKTVRDEELTSIEVPRDWWEHFKERWLPPWLLKKFPVRYMKQTFTCKVTRLCPHVELPPNHYRHVFWLNGQCDCQD